MSNMDFFSTTVAPRADQACDKLVAALPNLHLSTAKDLAVSTIPGRTYKQLFDACDVDDRFAEKCLPPRKQCSTDKNNVEFLKLFGGSASGNTLVFRAKAAVDVDGSPASKLGNPNDQSNTSLFFDEGSVDKTANAEEVSFLVIPQESYRSKRHTFYNTFFGRDSGVKTGDLAVAVYGKYCSFGVVGDTGPEFRLGEASMRTHAELGNSQCDKEHADEHPCLHVKNHGAGKGVDAAAVTYIIFPGTRPAHLISQTVREVTGKASREKAAKFINEFAK